MAEILDLSMAIQNGMSYFPGDPQPSVEQFKRVKEDVFALKRIVLGTHSGTHIDAPAHVVESGSSVDELDPLCASGTALVIGARVSDSQLVAQLNESECGAADVLLLYTSGNRYWEKDWSPDRTPRISADVAKRLARHPYRAIGIDSPSIGDAEVHKILLGSGKVIIENLTDSLRGLIGKRFRLLCVPLRLVKGDGSPVRALAILD